MQSFFVHLEGAVGETVSGEGCLLGLLRQGVLTPVYTASYAVL